MVILFHESVRYVKKAENHCHRGCKQNFCQIFYVKTFCNRMKKGKFKW